MQERSGVVRVLEGLGLVDTGPRYVLLADQRSLAACLPDSVRVMGGDQDYTLTLSSASSELSGRVSILRQQDDGDELVVATYAGQRPARRALRQIVRAGSQPRRRSGWLLVAVVVAVAVFANPFARLRAPPAVAAAAKASPARVSPSIRAVRPPLATLDGVTASIALDAGDVPPEGAIGFDDCGF